MYILLIIVPLMERYRPLIRMSNISFSNKRLTFRSLLEPPNKKILIPIGIDDVEKVVKTDESQGEDITERRSQSRFLQRKTKLTDFSVLLGKTSQIPAV